MHAAREQRARRYDELLGGLPLKLPARLLDRESAWHLYAVEVDAARTPATRAQVFAALRAAQVGVNVHYIPIHLQPFYRRMGFKPGDLPVAEAYYSRAISLPMYAGLTETEQDYVIQKSQEFLL